MITTDPEKVGPKVGDVDGRKMLQLLNDCSGAFEPGVLTALVGVSGAGMQRSTGLSTSPPSSRCRTSFGEGVLSMLMPPKK